MRRSFVRFGSVAMVALWIALAGSSAANAESIMKQCGDEWQSAKAAGTTNGQTWQQFLKSCRAQHQGGAQAPAAAPAAQAAPAPAAPAAAAGKTAKECNAEYAANKPAIKASGQKKADFIAACRAGTETIPQGAAAAPAPAPMPAPSAAPAPAPMAPAPTAAPTGAGQFASDQEAHARCPSDTVVWVNEKSHVYHFAGTHNYGHTKEGTYMCEADAKAAGDRAAMNEKHP
jgi:hypothetical protein